MVNAPEFGQMLWSHGGQEMFPPAYLEFDQPTYTTGINILCVQEVVTHFIKLIYKMGHYFLNI